MKKILFAFIFIFLISSVFAMSYPEGFNGNIVIIGGGCVEGKTLVGKINEVIIGSTIIHNNKFDIVVTDETGYGGTVEFYIGNKQAKETFMFNTFNVVTTDLTFTILSIDDDIEFCGDGICNDGETCSTCSSDCGSCSSGSGSSGSSGGGGGNTPEYTPTSSSPQDNGNENKVSDLSIKNLNENQRKSVGTGSAILDFTSSPTSITTILILIASVVGGIAFFSFKKGKFVKKDSETLNNPEAEDKE